MIHIDLTVFLHRLLFPVRPLADYANACCGGRKGSEHCARIIGVSTEEIVCVKDIAHIKFVHIHKRIPPIYPKALPALRRRLRSIF